MMVISTSYLKVAVASSVEHYADLSIREVVRHEECSVGQHTVDLPEWFNPTPAIESP